MYGLHPVQHIGVRSLHSSMHIIHVFDSVDLEVLIFGINGVICVFNLEFIIERNVEKKDSIVNTQIGFSNRYITFAKYIFANVSFQTHTLLILFSK